MNIDKHSPAVAQILWRKCSVDWTLVYMGLYASFQESLHNIMSIMATQPQVQDSVVSERVRGFMEKQLFCKTLFWKSRWCHKRAHTAKCFFDGIFLTICISNCICILTCLWCVSSVIVGRWKVRGLPAPDGFPQWGANNANNAWQTNTVAKETKNCGVSQRVVGAVLENANGI